jgi:phage-related minor tail protein
MKTFWQKVEGTTEQVIAEIRRLIEQGNVRRVVVKQHGKTIAEFPLTVGVVGAVIAPVAAAIGALAAVLTDCSIEVERTVSPAPRAETIEVVDVP